MQISSHLKLRFVSGKFVWDYSGYKLVKDQGGFFIGTSPEWQLATGTAAYFETSTPNFARQNGWVPWTNAYAYNEGYTKETTHDGERYRHVLCRAGSSGSTDDLVENSVQAADAQTCQTWQLDLRGKR